MRPRIIFVSHNKFYWEFFTEVHFHTYTKKVEVLCLVVSRLAKWNFPKAELMASREGEPQKCEGRLGSLTQTRVEERMLVVGFKGVQGFMQKPKFPQNHEPELRIRS
jgi:hypothetical protein